MGALSRARQKQDIALCLVRAQFSFFIEELVQEERQLVGVGAQAFEPGGDVGAVPARRFPEDRIGAEHKELSQLCAFEAEVLPPRPGGGPADLAAVHRAQHGIHHPQPSPYELGLSCFGHEGPGVRPGLLELVRDRFEALHEGRAPHAEAVVELPFVEEGRVGETAKAGEVEEPDGQVVALEDVPLLQVPALDP